MSDECNEGEYMSACDADNWNVNDDEYDASYDACVREDADAERSAVTEE